MLEIYLAVQVTNWAAVAGKKCFCRSGCMHDCCYASLLVGGDLGNLLRLLLLLKDQGPSFMVNLG